MAKKSPAEKVVKELRLTAVAIVEAFNLLAKNKPDISFQKKWKLVKDEVNKKFSANSRDWEQSWKSASGKAFEAITVTEALLILKKKKFSKVQITAKRWFELSKTEKEDLQIPLKRKCGGDRVLASNEPDIVVFKGGVAVAILSCKSSLRDRVSIDLSWARMNQDENRRFLVVTGASASELGTHAEPKKPRELAECIYERLYVLDTDVDYCDVVQPLSKLEKDIERWYL